MRIAVVRAHYSPFGGAERFLNVAVDSMMKHHHTPTILTRAWPQRSTVAIDHTIINPRYVTSAGRDRNFANAVRATLNQSSFDLVQSYERFAGCDVFHAVDGVHAEWLVQRERIQSPLQRLGVSLNPHHRYLRKAERDMYHSPKLRAVICISKMVRDDILAHYKIDPAKLHVIYGPIDTDKFRPARQGENFNSRRDEIRRKYAISANAPVAIHVGSGFERKGVRAFLQSVALVPGLYAFVVGQDKKLAAYQTLARSLDIAARVFFTGGIADVTPYYAASDVFVMPTIYEPFGLVFGEAMACGLPVVVSRKAGAQDWITHGENGFVVTATDVSEITEAIKAALANPTIGMRGRATVIAHNKIDVSDQYAALYQQLMSA